MEDRFIIGFESRRYVFIIIQQVIFSENLNSHFLLRRDQIVDAAGNIAFPLVTLHALPPAERPRAEQSREPVSFFVHHVLQFILLVPRKSYIFFQFVSFWILLFYLLIAGFGAHSSVPAGRYFVAHQERRNDSGELIVGILLVKFLSASLSVFID